MAERRALGSISLDSYLGKLKSMQTSYPKEALQKPSDKSAFEYGKHCGVLEGLLLAERLLLKTVEDEKNDKHE